MSRSKRFTLVAAPMFVLAACGGGDSEADPAAIDNHLNQIIVREEADREQRVADARVREAIRANEMEEEAANSSNEATNAAE